MSPQSVKHIHRIFSEALRKAESGQTSVAGVLESRLWVPVLLAATTRMRRGEILGLRWQDVDLDGGTLSVRQSLEQTRGSLKFKSPKTGKSQVIALPMSVVDALRRHKGQQAQHRLLLGLIYQDNGLVVAREDGTPVTPDCLTHAFADQLRKLNLPEVRFHGLRHSHATPAEGCERQGSTSSLTLNVYAPVLPGMQAAANLVDDS